MKRVLTAGLAIMLTSAKIAGAQSVDCDHVFTRVEQAICSNVELKRLDRELTILSDWAIAQQLVSVHAIHEIRNSLAMRCSSADLVDVCLIAQERAAIAQLALQTGQISEIPAGFRPAQMNTGSQPYARLRARFAQASEQQHATGDVKELAAATLDLLNAQRGDEAALGPAEVLEFEIKALESIVARGCNSLSHRRTWQQALRARGKSCETRRFP